jgi:putative transposase
LIAQDEALGQRAGIITACHALSLPRSSLYWARAKKPELQGHVSETKPPPRAISQEEKSEVRQVLNSERFQDFAPREVYATLLDEGKYLCH